MTRGGTTRTIDLKQPFERTLHASRDVLVDARTQRQRHRLVTLTVRQGDQVVSLASEAVPPPELPSSAELVDRPASNDAMWVPGVAMTAAARAVTR